MEKESYIDKKENVKLTFKFMDSEGWSAHNCEAAHFYSFNMMPFVYVGEKANDPLFMLTYIAVGAEEIRRGVLTDDAEMMLTYWLARYKRGDFKDLIEDKEELEKEIEWIESEIDVRYDIGNEMIKSK